MVVCAVIRATRVKGLEVTMSDRLWLKIGSNRLCKFAERGRALRAFFGVHGGVCGQERPTGRCDAFLHQNLAGAGRKTSRVVIVLYVSGGRSTALHCTVKGAAQQGRHGSTNWAKVYQNSAKLEWQKDTLHDFCDARIDSIAGFLRLELLIW